MPRSDGAEERASRAAWRDLAGAGSSRVGVSGAARARDIDRPTQQDLAVAEAELVIVRRRTDGAGGRQGRSQRSAKGGGAAR